MKAQYCILTLAVAAAIAIGLFLPQAVVSISDDWELRTVEMRSAETVSIRYDTYMTLSEKMELLRTMNYPGVLVDQGRYIDRSEVEQTAKDFITLIFGDIAFTSSFDVEALRINTSWNTTLIVWQCWVSFDGGDIRFFVDDVSGAILAFSAFLSWNLIDDRWPAREKEDLNEIADTVCALLEDNSSVDCVWIDDLRDNTEVFVRDKNHKVASVPLICNFEGGGMMIMFNTMMA